MSAFDALMEQARSGSVIITPDWMQGRAAFGGLTGAVVHQAMCQKLVDERPLRSLSVSFIGPAAADTPVSVGAEVLRQGKAVTQVESRLHQSGEVVVAALASFGSSRESTVTVAPKPAPEAKDPDSSKPMPEIEGVTPEFLRHFDLRFCMGGFPFTGSSERTMGGWMRFREPPRSISESHLVALVDTWPPAILPQLSQPAPASTLNWTMELVDPLPAVAPDDWLLYRATVDQAQGGYGLAQAGIWTRKGELVALSRQTVTVFA